MASTAALDGSSCHSTSLCETAACDAEAGQCLVETVIGDPTPCTSNCPTAEQCFMGWASQNGKCPAPVITKAWVASSGCFGTHGFFVEGANFQFLQDNTTIADYGPTAVGDGVNHKHWNQLTTTKLCVTIGVNSTYTAGKEIYMQNPDGKTSNCVVVENLKD